MVEEKIKRIWSKEENQIMLQKFSNTPTKEICKILNRSYSSVANQSFKMGLKKSEDFIKMEMQRQAERLKIVGVNGRFKKGNTSLNKGKKMTKELYKKCSATMFKKGHTPHNTNYDGHERISKDGYIHVRVKKGKYVLKHRLVWEKENGPIPKGFILVFKDNNKNNILLDNLELITMEENMKRNTIHRFPSELKNTIRLINKLNKTINAKEQN